MRYHWRCLLVDLLFDKRGVEHTTVCLVTTNNSIASNKKLTPSMKTSTFTMSLPSIVVLSLLRCRLHASRCAVKIPSCSSRMSYDLRSTSSCRLLESSSLSKICPCWRRIWWSTRRAINDLLPLHSSAYGDYSRRCRDSHVERFAHNVL